MRRVATVLGASAVVGAGLAVLRYLRRRAALIVAVDPGLRTPLLWLPTDLTNERALAFARRAVVRPTEPVPGVVVREVEARGAAPDPPVRLLTYERPDRSHRSGALLWVHGGGTVMGRPEAAHEFCSQIASSLGILVVNVDYRLAPENPFPAGLDDCATALAWLHDAADTLGIDADRIAVGGDSAGGLLAAPLAQVARDRGGPPIAFQLLVYPMLDDRTVLAAHGEGRDALIWTRASNEFAWGAYLGLPPGADEVPPHATPARTEDLAGLPPAWIGVGDIDLFYDEDLAYASRLRAAGVPCDLHVQPGLFHGADAVLPDRPVAQSFRGLVHVALDQAIGSGPLGAGFVESAGGAGEDACRGNGVGQA